MNSPWKHISRLHTKSAVDKTSYPTHEPEWARLRQVFLTKARANGDIVLSHPTTNEVAVIAPDGTLRTYFLPDPSLRGYETNLNHLNVQERGRIGKSQVSHLWICRVGRTGMGPRYRISQFQHLPMLWL